MREWMDIGSSPCDEDCVQVDPKVDYLPAMRAECRRFIELIRKKLGPEPPGARLAIKSNQHDFGPYTDVVCYYETEDEEAVAYAFLCEANAPQTWADDKPMPRKDWDVKVYFMGDLDDTGQTFRVSAPTADIAEIKAKVLARAARPSAEIDGCAVSEAKAEAQKEAA